MKGRLYLVYGFLFLIWIAVVIMHLRGVSLPLIITIIVALVVLWRQK